MSNYISVEDAIKTTWMILEGLGYAFDENPQLKETVPIVFDTAPTADVRPVVRCKDCRHRDPEDHKCDSGQLERAGCVFPVDDDYFCAYGER